MKIVLALVGGFLLALVAMFLFPFVLTGVLVGVATLVAAVPRHPWHRLGWEYARGYRASRWWATTGALASAALVGFLALSLFQSLRATAEGRLSEATPAAISGVVLLAVLASIVTIARKKPMPNIFQLASDAAALEAFVTNTPGPGTRSPLPEIDPARLAELVRAEVIGQDAIVTDVAGQLARRIRLARPNRPLGVFLFVGATGAGKTELAKALAKQAFEGRLTRVDCNELTESHAAQRLIGAPPGYIGAEQGGQLTRAITQLGSGVILLDEIEKAHEAVLRVLMGLLDEGRLTEASTGQVADASQFLIVMTSNAEHGKLADIAATITDADERRRAVKDTLTGVFRPEQLARIDDIHCFAPLDRRALVQVVGKFLQHFATESGVDLASVDTSLLVETVLRHEKGAKYGIRELIRLVERAIVDGMLDRRAEGFKRVAIRCEGDAVRVVGIPDGVDAASYLAANTAPRATA